MAEHRNLTGSSLHEPKGTATANAGEVYVADGAGSGEWKDKNIYEDTYWTDVRTAVATTKFGASPPDFIQFNDNGSGSTGVFATAFDPATIEEVFFTVQLPHGYKAGTDVCPHVHWAASDANAGDVVWGLEYCLNIYGATPGNTTIIYATGTTPGVAKKQVITEFADIDGTNLKESSIINCRLFRAATDAGDTYASDAFAIETDFHHQIEKPGTSDEWPDGVTL